MAEDDVLIGPLLKTERAKYHIIDLNRQIDTFMAERPFRWVESFDPKTLQKTYATKTHKPMPPEFALIIGDAVHNLRSALDLIVFALIGDKVKTPESVQFPFARKPESLQAAIDSRQISVAGEKVVQAIRDLQPYPGGCQKLHELYTLDITDKHKLIIPVATPGIMGSTDFAKFLPLKGRSNVQMMIDAGAVFVEQLSPGHESNERWLRSLPGYVDKETELQPTYMICFADGQPFAHQQVVDALAALAEIVKAAVSKIATAADES